MFQLLVEIDCELSRCKVVARILCHCNGSLCIVFFCHESDVGHEFCSCDRNFHVLCGIVGVERVNINRIVAVRHKRVITVIGSGQIRHRDVVVACIAVCAHAHKSKTDRCGSVPFNKRALFEGVVHVDDVGCVVISVHSRDRLEAVFVKHAFGDGSGHIGEFHLDALHAVDDVLGDFHVGLIVDAVRFDFDLVGFIAEDEEQGDVDNVVAADVDARELAAFDCDDLRLLVFKRACEHLCSDALLVLSGCDRHVIYGEILRLVVLFFNGDIALYNADDAVDDVDKLACAVDADDFDLRNVGKIVRCVCVKSVDLRADCIIDNGCYHVVVRLVACKSQGFENDACALYIAGRADLVVLRADGEIHVVACDCEHACKVVYLG